MHALFERQILYSFSKLDPGPIPPELQVNTYFACKYIHACTCTCYFTCKYIHACMCIGAWPWISCVHMVGWGGGGCIHSYAHLYTRTSTSKCGLRPHAVLQSVQMFVTINTCHCVALQGSYECSARPPCSIMGTAMAAVLPRFRGLGKGIS